jgi:hypothetical protein
MKKDLDEVLTLIKGLIEIDNMVTKQSECIDKLRETHPSIGLIKELDHVENAIDALQTTIDSVYYNLIGE